MFLRDVVELAKGCEHVIIVGHVNPDGDCVGSSLALAMLLQKYNVASKILLKDIPSTYSFLPTSQWLCDKEPSKIDLLISLDCGDVSRLGDFKSWVEKAGKVINIDHHMSNTNFGQYNYVLSEASSTCEIIYGMIEDGSILDQNIAIALYTGIIYDTGVFKHSNTTEQTLCIAGKLVSYGFDFTEIINKLFCYKSMNGLLAQSKSIENIQMFSNNKIAITYLSRYDIDALNATKKETENIVQMLNEIENVECAVFIYETAMDEYKVSFRSKGVVDVCEIAQYFGGGGHKKASGCSVEGHLSIVIQKMVNRINEQLKNK
ncbi:MAG: bifunctional oligoribonuclease/PAP phosphatase NrnA [Vallitaleaceae bacterium]|nr:bifunctional oligoribonuclease/PAP phosphatase NrnA [Vallitaleaceae bacterium]